MIIIVQKTFAVKGKKAQSVLAGLKLGNFIRKKVEGRSIKSGAKQVARSLNDTIEKEKLSQYKEGSSLYKRKKARLRRERKTRIQGLQRRAERKLQDFSKVKTPEQLESRAQELADKATVKGAVDYAKSAPIKVGKSVMQGAEKAYKHTGTVALNIGAKVVEHPIATPGWFSGDAVNIVGTATGHPEVTLVPVGTIASGAGLAVEKVLPRKTRRKLRQKAIRLKKEGKLHGKSLSNLVNELKELKKIDHGARLQH